MVDPVSRGLFVDVDIEKGSFIEVTCLCVTTGRVWKFKKYEVGRNE